MVIHANDFHYIHLSRRSADALLDESGCILDHPSATKFRQNVLAGKWSKADHYLKELEAMMSDYHSNLVVSSLICICFYID